MRCGHELTRENLHNAQDKMKRQYDKKINYLISTPDRKKSIRSVHVNLLRKYEGKVVAMAAIGVDAEKMPDQTVKGVGMDDFSHEKGDHRLANSLALEKVS
ncbi:hypothetical protein E2C01_060183 [Portunus trituberculatus]|uniref:Uncharacterized protein n=1 Tax=Portunus trituberculatus TaxID=210409 RepID=A0A5B7H1J9_PORTR|nr:hypothetical protein [Portunus trituberculatus]